MKKIIYSLVIMIAAGSLFTSCIEQVEPLGIQDMRFAKAEYIRALKDLRAADAEYVRAQAAFELARARYKDAQTANLNADTEYQQLLNEYQQLINEARQDTNDFISQEIANRIDSVKKRMELREKEHAAKMVAAEDSLAMAQERLRITLRNIALYSQSLTPAEQMALADAVFMYETAVEETAAQTIVVLQAQRTLDSLQMVREVGPDTAYDKSSKAYIGQVAKWKKDIETKQVQQALVAATLLAVPDSLVYDDVDGWKAQIDALVEDSAAVEYNKYETKMEMANYYTTYLHDGVEAFNNKVTEFNEKWKDAVKTAPTKPTKAEYTSKNADSLKVVLTKPKDADIAWAKFTYLLDSYKNDFFPKSKATPKNKVATFKGSDTVTFIFDHNMADFVMGAAGNGTNSQVYQDSLKADYGLYGIYDILSRDKVIGETAAPTPEAIAKAKEDMEKAKAKWEKDRKILIDGVAAYVPFQEAEAALATEEEENGKGAAKMVQAIKDLQSALKATGTKFSSFDGNDSTKLFGAIVEFAQAREDYLDFKTSVEEIDPNVPEKRDSSVFYYSKGKSGAGKAIFASKKFSELTEADLKAGEYEYNATEPGDVKFITGDPDSVVNAFANIINQMASELNNVFDTTNDTIDFSKAAIDGTHPFWTAMYKKYQLDSWSDPKAIQNADGSAYEPKALKDAKDSVVTKINEYIKAYNDFWGLNVPDADTTTGTAADKLKAYFVAMDGGDEETIAEKKAELITAVETACSKTPRNPECYTEATFKTFTTEEGKPIVFFDGTANIIQTEALLAVLTAVDPLTPDNKKTDNAYWKDNINGTAIFNGGATDFFNYMKAASDYYSKVNGKASENLKKIKDLIDKVQKAIDDDEAQAGVFDEDAYNDAMADYNDDKASYDEYVAAKKAFAGTDAKGKANAIITLATTPAPAPFVAAPNNFVSVDEVTMMQLLEKNIYGDFTGEWTSKLGGEQLAAANELFPEYPANIKAWDEEIKDANDQITHDRVLIAAAKEAYYAAAKVADELVKSETGAPAANWDQLVQNYKDANKRYRDRLVGIIETLQGQIETLEECIAKFNQGLPQLDIAIAKAQKELEVETARLKGYEDALAYAKANLDHLLEYIKSLDVNFVVPAVDYEI